MPLKLCKKILKELDKKYKFNNNNIGVANEF
jgi:hypothetical protein